MPLLKVDAMHHHDVLINKINKILITILKTD